jgi:oligopeptide transport system substrate-binding protein
MYRFGWLSPFVDAYANLVVFHSDNPNNYTGWKNKQYDALLRRIELLDQGRPERQKLIDQAQRILLEEAVTVVPIFHYVQTVVISNRVQDFWVNGMGMVDYMNVRAK